MIRVLEALFGGLVVATLFAASVAVWWAAWMMGWWAVAALLAASVAVAAALWIDGGDA